VSAENLEHLLGGYFHQDWAREHSSAEACLEHMLRSAPPDQRRLGAEEIAELLSRGLCENQIRDVVLYELGCCYALESDGLEASSWLRHVRTRLLESLRRDTPP
jgi:CdiI immunity protein